MRVTDAEREVVFIHLMCQHIEPHQPDRIDISSPVDLIGSTYQAPDRVDILSPVDLI